MCAACNKHALHVVLLISPRLAAVVSLLQYMTTYGPDVVASLPSHINSPETIGKLRLKHGLFLTR